MKLRWPWRKSIGFSESSEIGESVYENSNETGPSKVPLVTSLGSFGAAVASTLLGDPTFGVATTAIVGAVIGLAGSAHSHFSAVHASTSTNSDLLVVYELRALNKTLRALLLMAVFGGLAFIARTFFDLLSRQFDVVDEHPLIFIVILFFFYWHISRSARN